MDYVFPSVGALPAPNYRHQPLLGRENLRFSLPGNSNRYLPLRSKEAAEDGARARRRRRDHHASSDSTSATDAAHASTAATDASTSASTAATSASAARRRRRRQPRPRPRRPEREERPVEVADRASGGRRLLAFAFLVVTGAVSAVLLLGGHELSIWTYTAAQTSCTCSPAAGTPLLPPSSSRSSVLHWLEHSRSTGRPKKPRTRRREAKEEGLWPKRAGGCASTSQAMPLMAEPPRAGMAGPGS